MTDSVEGFLKGVADAQDTIVTAYGIHNLMVDREARRKFIGVRSLNRTLPNTGPVYRETVDMWGKFNARPGQPSSWDSILLNNVHGALVAESAEDYESQLIATASTALEMWEQSRREHGGASEDIASYFEGLLK